MPKLISKLVPAISHGVNVLGFSVGFDWFWRAWVVRSNLSAGLLVSWGLSSFCKVAFLIGGGTAPLMGLNSLVSRVLLFITVWVSFGFRES